jgi:K+-sensing histidine kinase KdpD
MITRKDDLYRMKNILVCVTKQNTIKQLIEKGIELRNMTKGTLHILHVTKKDIADCSEEIQFLYDICKPYEAFISIVRSANVVKAIQQYVKEHHIHKIILGETRQENIVQSTMFKLQSALHGEAEIVIVPVKEKVEYKDVI